MTPTLPHDAGRIGNVIDDEGKLHPVYYSALAGFQGTESEFIAAGLAYTPDNTEMLDAERYRGPRWL